MDFHAPDLPAGRLERPPFVRRVAPAVGLFFLSPLVAEFLLGNIAVDALWVLPFVAPLYGGGAILVREVGRRIGRGWPGLFLLALAYAVVEEGLVTQTLFSRSYFGFDLLAEAYIPAIGMGGWWTLYVLALHTVWSIAVPIAVVEAFVPEREAKPWLGPVGLAVAGVVFAGGAALNFAMTYEQEHFIAEPAQLAGAALAAIALVAGAFFVPSPGAAAVPPAPGVWRVGVFTFLAASLFVGVREVQFGWPIVATYLAVFVGSAAVLWQWAGRAGWNQTHRLAAAGGALMAYAWQGFPHEPIMGSKGTIDLIGNAIFGLGAVVLLYLAAAKLRRSMPAEQNSPVGTMG